MGTSMWINREDPIERQHGECVKQIAYLVGIVLNDETSTTGWATTMLWKNPDFSKMIFSLHSFPTLWRAPMTAMRALVVEKL
ncbi:MAG: hypothetical protein NPIRA03_17670 [Nitrospirales bacterium]|nr:MAG: hypothetical protein NPIRA03_17670 [Nitrospirales bacterium]